MVYHVWHWYNGQTNPPVPEAKKYEFTNVDGTKWTGWSVKTRSIHKFTAKHGPIQLRPPTDKFPYWQIVVTDKSGRFSQK